MATLPINRDATSTKQQHLDDHNELHRLHNVLEDEGRIFRFVFDGGGVTLATGAKKAYLSVPFNCTITKARLIADQTGSIVIDVWKSTYANFPPTVANTITASAKPTLTSAQKSEDATLTGWSKTLNVGDIIEVNIDSVTTVTRVYLDLFVILV